MNMNIGKRFHFGSSAPADGGAAKRAGAPAQGAAPNPTKDGGRSPMSTEAPSAKDLRSRMQGMLPSTQGQASRTPNAAAQPDRGLAQTGSAAARPQYVESDRARHQAPPKDDGSTKFVDDMSFHKRVMAEAGKRMFPAAQADKAAKGIDVDTARHALPGTAGMNAMEGRPLFENAQAEKAAKGIDVDVTRHQNKQVLQGIDRDRGRYDAPPTDDGTLKSMDALQTHKQVMAEAGNRMFTMAQSEKAAKGIDVDTTRREKPNSDPVFARQMLNAQADLGEVLFGMAQGEKAAKGIDVDTTRREKKSSDPDTAGTVSYFKREDGKTMFGWAQDEKAAKGIDVDTTRHQPKSTAFPETARTISRFQGEHSDELRDLANNEKATKGLSGVAKNENAATGANAETALAQTKAKLQSKAEAAIPSPDKSAAGIASAASQGRATPAA
jgi:hypothetical protein